MDGPDQIRVIVNTVLEALQSALAGQARNGAISMSAMDAVLAQFMESGEFAPYYRQAFETLAARLSPVAVEDRRANALGRLLIHPLSPKFADGTLDRQNLFNLFQAFRLILGDEEEQLGAQCMAITGELRERRGVSFIWDDFYRDAGAVRVGWTVLAKIATAFKRWDVRKDWFLKLMQYQRNTVSLGPMAFQVKDPAHGEPAQVKPFTEADFAEVFRGLFAPIAQLTPMDLAAFRSHVGTAAAAQVEAVLTRLY